uniref:Permease n=1 Tax=Heterorhabditis bacteriophora TaxID=37862 RepID=A0A1I7XGA7_HETBA
MEAISNSAWFAVPYPVFRIFKGKFGTPRFETGLFFAYLLSAMTSVFESVGDYHAAARVSNERAPPSHAINRGILAEGMGSFLSGLLGPGVGMTTHTENIGVIGVTRVASRWTMVVAGLLLIVLGVCTKVGAILSTIPEPLVGGILASSMAMVVGVAVSNLQTVCHYIFGLNYIAASDILFVIVTAITGIDNLLNVLLTLPMFVGAMCACFLDNTVGDYIGANREQRGLRPRGESYEISMENDVYSYPPFVMKILNKIPFINYLPCIPKEKKATNKVAERFSSPQKKHEIRL